MAKGILKKKCNCSAMGVKSKLQKSKTGVYIPKKSFVLQNAKFKTTTKA